MTTATKEKLNQLAKEAGFGSETLQQIESLLSKATDPWEEAKGILRHKKIDALKYQKKVRREWGN